MKRIAMALSFMLGAALVSVPVLGENAAQAQAPADEPSLASVLSAFAKIDALRVNFREQKFMALLTIPLVSEGELYYQKPRLLARHTQKPARSSLVLHDGELTFGDAQHQESMGVNSLPSVRVLVDTFVSVLAGDQATLLAMAEVKLSRLGEHGFRILVTPREANVQKLVRSMMFEGEGTTLKSMELLDANGDRSVTTFSNLRVRKPFSADEAKQIFRVGAETPRGTLTGP
jgi:outer membrane lipoprotein-sorting protein